MTKSIQDSLSKVKAHLEAECFNKLYIGGKFVEPINGKTYPTYYPATGELLHEFPCPVSYTHLTLPTTPYV